jgi:hypothetical protein
MLVICFGFLLYLGCNLVIIGDTYVVYRFNGCFLFIGSSVISCCCLVQVCEFEVLRLQLGLFVLPRWFVSCCFLLFALALQGWGPTSAVTAVFFALCGVQVLHPQVNLWFCRLSCLEKSRSDACPVPAYPVLKFCSNFFS